MNKLILQQWTKERLAEEWIREHIERKQLLEENERLNNIINELEKWLKEGMEELSYIKGDMYWREACENVLNKLQELKDSDEE